VVDQLLLVVRQCRHVRHQPASVCHVSLAFIRTRPSFTTTVSTHNSSHEQHAHLSECTARVIASVQCQHQDVYAHDNAVQPQLCKNHVHT
jgi:hypothetical protein